MAKRARDLERTYSRSQFVAKLRRLADALETRRPFNIQVGGERLYVPAAAVFNIEHERVDGEDELEFQLRWREVPEQAPVANSRRSPAARKKAKKAARRK